jgi:hypothetical protein
MCIPSVHLQMNLVRKAYEQKSYGLWRVPEVVLNRQYDGRVQTSNLNASFMPDANHTIVP